jgi:hypothetical protein
MKRLIVSISIAVCFLFSCLLSNSIAQEGPKYDVFGNKWDFYVSNVRTSSDTVYVEVASTSSADGWVNVNIWADWHNGWGTYKVVTIKQGGYGTAEFPIPPSFTNKNFRVRLKLTGGMGNVWTFSHLTEELSR